MQDIRICARDICSLLDVASTKKCFKALFKKFSSTMQFEVAIFCKRISEETRPQAAVN